MSCELFFVCTILLLTSAIGVLLQLKLVVFSRVYKNKKIPSEMDVAPRYTIQTAVFILLGKVGTLLDWADGLQSKMLD